MNYKKQRNIKIRHALEVMLFDILAINGSYLAALFVRFDFRWSMIPAIELYNFRWCALIFTAISVLIYYLLHLYQFVWSYISVNEIGKILAAVALSSVAHFLASYAFSHRMPISVYFIAFMINLFAALFVRYAYRFYKSITRMNSVRALTGKKVSRAMLIGAGTAGQMLIRHLNQGQENDVSIQCIIDDNAGLKGKYIGDIPIVGGKEYILQSVEKYDIDTIIYAIPSSSPKTKRDYLNICNSTGCKLRIIPGFYQFVSGEINMNSVRDVSIEDLLGRDTVNVNLDEIMGYVENKVILVTGGGGSIGSELCRQIAYHFPKQLIIFDIYENNAYDIQQELKRKYPQLDLKVLIGSVRDEKRLDMIFRQYRPDIIYHAAAHKHVPLMEDSPNEVIKNNVFGTYKTAKCAIQYQAEKFVLISTDKAVNPTNIMGASKRLCEMVVQMMNNHSDTEFVAVRFGNVLGSNGSVIPLFKRQIEEGGPVTVTHPDIIRYFMTIPEAVSLVLQAGAYAKGGEIFVLDMGEPVKIVDLAKNLIRLSGYIPDVDMPIQYTGLRPGEKLFEELLMKDEGLRETENKLIYIGRPIELDEDKFMKDLDALYEKCNDNCDTIKDAVEEIVPTYKRKKEEKATAAL